MSLTNTQIFIGILLSLFTATITVYSIFAKARESTPKIRIDLRIVQDTNNYYALLFRLLNYGPQAVGVYKVGYKFPIYYNHLPERFPKPKFRLLNFLPLSWFPRLHRFASSTGLILSFLVEDIDIYTIPPNEYCEIFDNHIHCIAHRLKKMGFSGEIELIGFCEDFSTRIYKSAPLRFNIDWWVKQECLEIEREKRSYFQSKSAA